MKRTDIHSEANFQPEDYEVVGYISWATDDKTSLATTRDYRIAMAQLIQGSTTTAYHSAHQCDHCGAHLTYVVVVHHVPTGDYLAFGETCADGRLDISKAEFDRMRKQSAAERAAQKILKAWTEFQASLPAIDWAGLAESDNAFISEILRKGRQYGELSSRQVEAIVKAYQGDLEYAASKANEPPKTTAPVGRATVTGTVLTVKSVEGQYGSTRKMLVSVVSEQGQWKCWGTAPRLDEGYVCKGDEVTFTAMFEQARDDESFAFFKRPTKTSIRREATYECDKCEATVTVMDESGAEGWYFDEDAYLCPACQLVNA